MNKMMYAAMLAIGMLLLGLAPSGKSAPVDPANNMPINAAHDENETLRQYADKLGFGIGVFIQPRYWKKDPEHQQIMGREFNRAVTYPVKIQNERGHYDFELMDEEMKFAKQHNMKLYGAGLIYRTMSSPDWLHFTARSCGGFSQSEIEQIMKEDIQTIVKHGGDMYYTWDVVNEPTSRGHNGCWSVLFGGYDHGGQDRMIAKATQYAYEANPNVPLMLNDAFGQAGVDREQADQMFELIKRVRKLGGHVDVVGCELHLEAQQLHPGYVDEFKYFLEQARKTGVTVQVTEMDVYQGPAGAFQDPYENQKQIFYNIAHACLKDSNCTTFTVWGLYDSASWLHEAKGLTDANPVLFDSNYKKKPAYYGVLEALKDGR